MPCMVEQYVSLDENAVDVFTIGLELWSDRWSQKKSDAQDVKGTRCSRILSGY